MNVDEYIKGRAKDGWIVAKHNSFQIGDSPADGIHHHIVFIDDGTCPFGSGLMQIVNLEESYNGSCFVKQDIISTITGMSQDILEAAMAVGRRK